MKKTLGVCILLVLAGCSDKKSLEDNNMEESQADPTQFKEELEIHPEMYGRHAYELGELIKNLMPESSKPSATDTWDWDQLANDQKILWVTEGYDEKYNAYNMSTMTYRQGYVRVHQLGERVSQLKDRKYEVLWTIRYEGAEAKFGVNLITLQPDIDKMVSFPDPEPSLKKQGLKIKIICEQSYLGEQTKVSRLEARQKQPIYLIDRISAGSAGESRWLELSQQDLTTEWCADESQEL